MKIVTCKKLMFVLTMLFALQLNAQQRTYGKARLEYHEGIPFVWLEGSSYEVGFQYGKLLKNELESLRKDYVIFRNKAIGIDKMSYFKRLMFNWFGESKISDRLDKVVDKIPEDVNQMIKGVAEGADVSLDVLYELNFWYDIRNDGISCSSLLMKKGGQVVHAWNHDAPGGGIIGKHPVIMNCKIDGKIPYVKFGVIGRMLTISGINEAGISISINALDDIYDYKKESCNTHALMNKVMTDCRTMDEVEALFDTINLNIGHIFSIGSQKEFKAATFDTYGTVNQRTDVEEVQYIPNYAISPALARKYEHRYSRSFGNTARVDKFNEIYPKENTTDLVSTAANIFANTDFYHYESLGMINRPYTVQSIIFDAANTSIYFASDSAFAGWSNRIHYNYKSGEVSVYRGEHPKRSTKATKDYVNYSIADHDFENIEEAKSFFTNIKLQGIENHNTLTDAFNTYVGFGNYELAKQAAEKLIERYPDVVLGYYYRALASERINEFKDAIKWYKQALEAPINNEYRLLLINTHMALVYQSMNNPAQAKIYANEAIAFYNRFYIPENDNYYARLQEIMK